MSDGASTLTPETPPVETPPAEPVAVPPVDQEAAELAALETSAVEVPEGDGIVKLVPLAAVTKPREEAKVLRGENKTLKEQLDAAQRAAQAAQPYVDAAKAILAQPQAPVTPQQVGPTPEEQAELEEIARDFDFYKTDGSLDLDRSVRYQARLRREAANIAAAQVAPLQQDASIAKAQSVLTQAKAWQDPVTKEQADPEILKSLWNQVATQPGGLDTLANPQAAMFVWGQALNLTRWKKGQGGSATPVRHAAPVTLDPPVFVEPSGGGAAPVTLSAMERRAAADMGMSEAEYLKAAAKAPRGM